MLNKLFLIPAILLSTSVMADNDLRSKPYADFIGYCSTSGPSEANACMAYYAGVLDAIKNMSSIPAVSKVMNTCLGVYSAKRYSEAHDQLMNDGWAKKITTSQFIISVYQKASSCEHLKTNEPVKREE